MCYWMRSSTRNFRIPGWQGRDQWLAVRMFQQRLSGHMDPRLQNQYSIGAAREIAKLADTCLVKSRKQRPKMSEVVEILKQIIQASEEGIAEETGIPIGASEIQAAETEEKTNNRSGRGGWHILRSWESM
ncbi:hypothetical protein F3Y22_tig00110621pilonHSYRG00366 [Hibiscus syriacus]|uniref:Uncharacterized protein n=1 Tax=Hibiscus syriacus TaxID=106335 RepID=A0A6A3A2R1_HIBSY|nr:hypothetical protein F3Y22_tig00110621pilonHSYRG00366 [Hibiscus syriacus]